MSFFRRPAGVRVAIAAMAAMLSSTLRIAPNLQRTVPRGSRAKGPFPKPMPQKTFQLRKEIKEWNERIDAANADERGRPSKTHLRHAQHATRKARHVKAAGEPRLEVMKRSMARRRRVYAGFDGRVARVRIGSSIGPMQGV